MSPNAWDAPGPVVDAWLEDARDPRTIAWSKAQDEMTRTALDDVGGPSAVLDLTASFTGVPRWAGDRMFVMRLRPGADAPALETARDPLRTGTVLPPTAPLVDEGTWGSPRVLGWAPSPDGTLVAVVVADGPDEHASLHVVDAATGRAVLAPRPAARTGALAWARDGRSVWHAHEESRTERSHDRNGPPLRRVLRTDVDRDSSIAVLGLPTTSGPVRALVASDDGRWLLSTAHVAGQDTLWLLGLDAGAPPGALPVAAGPPGSLVDVGFAPGGRLWLLTTALAPRGQLLVAEPPGPGAAPTWEVLITASSQDVLRGAAWRGGDDRHDEVVVSSTRHGAARLAVHDACSGHQRAEVFTPSPGTVLDLGVTPAGDMLVQWTDLLRPPGLWGLTDVEGVGAHLVPLETSGDAPPDHVVDHLCVRARDQERVPVFLLRPAGDPVARPLLLTVYGGFGMSSRPVRSAAAQAWVEAGGAWALACVRGGGEEGSEWHRAGQGAHKQRAVDDLLDVASDLERRGLAAPGRTALVGSSHGGLLVTAAAAQHPEACAAVAATAPVADLLRFATTWPGSTWRSELGDPEDLDDQARLALLSPCHRLAPARRQPAVLITVDEDDARVPAWHSRRLVHQWQQVLEDGGGVGGPVLLRRGTGHGHVTSSVEREADHAGEELMFLARATGLQGFPGGPAS